MAKASQTLADSETGAKKQAKLTKSLKSTTRYPAGTEWELLQTDATILHALTLALKYVLLGSINMFTKTIESRKRVVYGLSTMLL
jgi:hypothetical protein